MIKVILRKRRSAVLTPSSLFCISRTPTVNLTAGCAHGCLYCYARGFSSYPGEDRIVLYEDVLERLRDELKRKRRKPKAVYCSTSSDLFQPVPEVLELAYDVLKLFFENGIGVTFLTKGVIPEKHLKLIGKYPDLAYAGIGIISVSEKITSVFEPGAAAPEARIGNIRKLVRLGVRTQARLDPILPGLTDTDSEILNLLSAIAGAGARRISASTLFLRNSIKANLAKRRSGSRFVGRVLEQFNGASRMDMRAAGRSEIIALPERKRRAIYESIESHCGKLGIEMKCCACKNQDITGKSCSIVGRFPANPPRRERQGTLFPKPISKSL